MATPLLPSLRQERPSASGKSAVGKSDPLTGAEDSFLRKHAEQSRSYDAAMTHLRRITVFVDEPVHGRFHWVLHELHESIEDASIWKDILSSEESYETWADAFEAGCLELFKLAPDERIGPQTFGEHRT